MLKQLMFSLMVRDLSGVLRKRAKLCIARIESGF